MAEIKRTKPFEHCLNKILKKFPKSQASIDKQIGSLTISQSQGDKVPGFGCLEVRKLRIHLKEYKLGKSNGARLLYLYIPDKDVVLPIDIYPKKPSRPEREILNTTKKTIAEILQELQDG